MTTEIRTEKLTGVGAFIVNIDRPNLFLSITESESKRSSNKLAGMISAPFETIDSGETHRQALERIFYKVGENGEDGEEELIIVRGQIFISEDLNSSKLCLEQLSEGVWLHAYLLHCSSDLIVKKGKAADTIGDPQWVSVEDVLKSASGNSRFHFRPGNLELVESYLDFQKNRDTFTTRIYQMLANVVPEQVFDLIEKDFSVSEALSLSGLDPKPLINSLFSIHSLTSQ